MSGTDPSQRSGDPGRRPGGFLDWMRRLGRSRNGEGSIRDTLEELADRHEQDATPITPAERVILENTLKLRNVTLEDVMVPRADIMAVDVSSSLEAVVERIGETHHSRLPVYEGQLDTVLGMIHVKDVLTALGQDPPPALGSMVRDVLFVVPSMRVLDLLLQMRLSRLHMAMVIDEYGGIDGLVTIENLVEEIVGEIEDEHEIVETTDIRTRPDGTLIADARTTLEDFEAMVGDVLSEEEREEIDTLGGLVFTYIGRVPGRGEIVTHDSGIEFEVLEGDPRRLKRLRIRNLPADVSAPAAAAVPAEAPKSS